MNENINRFITVQMAFGVIENLLKDVPRPWNVTCTADERTVEPPSFTVKGDWGLGLQNGIPVRMDHLEEDLPNLRYACLQARETYKEIERRRKEAEAAMSAFDPDEPPF